MSPPLLITNSFVGWKAEAMLKLFGVRLSNEKIRQSAALTVLYSFWRAHLNKTSLGFGSDNKKKAICDQFGMRRFKIHKQKI
jgi:hypothetical protein